MISRLLSRLTHLPIADQDGKLNLSETKKQNSVIHKLLSDLLNTYLEQFTAFFESNCSGISNLSKGQRKDLSLTIHKIQHILKISTTYDQSESDQGNICSESQLSKILQIVQQIIN